MAWDTEATRRKLLDAGARQFAAFGYAGSRMDAIGRDAGVNKERVYRYFGNKQGFFAAVLSRELTGLLDGVEVTGVGPEAIGDLAGTMFDRSQARPDLARLLAWESLELDRTVAIEQRRPMCAATATGIRAALSGVGQPEADHLLLSVISLVTSWTTLARVAGAVLSEVVGPEVRRAAIVSQVTAMASALDGQEGPPAALVPRGPLPHP